MKSVISCMLTGELQHKFTHTVFIAAGTQDSVVMSTQCFFTWSPIMGWFSSGQGNTYLSFIFRSALLNHLPRVNKPGVILSTFKGKSSNYGSGKKMLFCPPLELHSTSLRSLKGSETAYFTHNSLLAVLGYQHWRSSCHWHTTISRSVLLGSLSSITVVYLRKAFKCPHDWL